MIADVCTVSDIKRNKDKSENLNFKLGIIKQDTTFYQAVILTHFV